MDHLSSSLCTGVTKLFYAGMCIHCTRRRLRRSYLKANKISKSEGIRKVEYAYHFSKCADVYQQELSYRAGLSILATLCKQKFGGP